MNQLLMNQLREVFGNTFKLSSDVEEAFLDSVVKKKYKKKSILQREGRICNEIYFIEKGIARTFYYKNEKDITYWIAAENEFVGAMASFCSRTLSNKWVETLEDSVIWVFDYYKIERLLQQSIELERMGRLFAYYGITMLEKKFDDFHFLSAKERYTLLIDKHPEIIQRVSLGIIASYLGITQETLSRIRNQN
jgi:CRP-like cAMP-binding protein